MAIPPGASVVDLQHDGPHDGARLPVAGRYLECDDHDGPDDDIPTGPP